MSYVGASRPRQGFGNIYSFPQTNNMGIVPNGTFNVNVPIQQITHDAMVAAWPEASSWAMTLATQEAPALVDAAWPRVLQRLPEAVAAAKPYVSGLVAEMVPTVWATLKPQVETEIGAIIQREEGKAALVGGALAAVALVGGLAVAHKLGWIRLPIR